MERASNTDNASGRDTEVGSILNGEQYDRIQVEWRLVAWISMGRLEISHSPLIRRILSVKETCNIHPPKGKLRRQPAPL